MKVVTMIDYDAIWQVGQTIKDFFGIGDFLEILIENKDTKFVMQCFGTMIQSWARTTNNK